MFSALSVSNVDFVPRDISALLDPFCLDGGKCFSNRVLVETNFEASKRLVLKAFQSLKNGLD